MDTLSTLKAMRQLLIEHGWCQRQLQNDAGQVCLIGALKAIREHGCFPGFIEEAHLDVLNALITAMYPKQDLVALLEGTTKTAIVTKWNDHEGRRKQTVLRMLDQAISQLEPALESMQVEAREQDLAVAGD